jgi:hypothetical protein
MAWNKVRIVIREVLATVSFQTGAALMDDSHFAHFFATLLVRSPCHRILPTVLANAAIRGHNPWCWQSW